MSPPQVILLAGMKRSGRSSMGEGRSGVTRRCMDSEKVDR